MTPATISAIAARAWSDLTVRVVAPPANKPSRDTLPDARVVSPLPEIRKRAGLCEPMGLMSDE